MTTLKSVVAAPDFRDNERGIPDGNSGRSFVMESTALVTLNCKNGQTTFMVVPPTPLVSHYIATAPLSDPDSVILSGSSFSGYLFPQNIDLFPHYNTVGNPALAYSDIVNTTTVDQFRVITHSCELVNTNNAFTTYGTITAYKTNMNMTQTPYIEPLTPIGNIFQISGANPIGQDVASTGDYVMPSRSGVYSVAMCHTGEAGEFPFRPIFDRVHFKVGILAPIVSMAGVPASLKFFPAPPGWDNSYDTHVYRVSVPEGAPDQQFVFKVWRRIEYVPVMYSLVWHIAAQGERRSDAFFKMYGTMERNLPVAVQAKENPEFWDTMLNTVKNVSSIARLIPGAGGLVADVIHRGATAISKARKGKSTKASVTYHASEKKKKKIKREAKKERKVRR